MNEKVKSEVMAAYKDCWSTSEDWTDRSLRFFASEFVSKADAIAILNECLPDGGYNEFEPSLLNLFSDNTLFQIARENSICIYEKGNTNNISKEALKADEMSLEKDGTTRIWWD
jgi:hypothetical protein